MNFPYKFQSFNQLSDDWHICFYSFKGGEARTQIPYMNAHLRQFFVLYPNPNLQENGGANV